MSRVKRQRRKKRREEARKLVESKSKTFDKFAITFFGSILFFICFIAINVFYPDIIPEEYRAPITLHLFSIPVIIWLIPILKNKQFHLGEAGNAKLVTSTSNSFTYKFHIIITFTLFIFVNLFAISKW